MSEQFCLRWNNHQSTLISVFENLLESGSLIDCTLCAEGQLLKAHKVVLSACSPTFESMLCIQEDKHPIIFLKDVRFIELKAMIDYMYKGEVNILQDQLDSFLKTAAALQIKGLTDQGGGGGDEPPAKKGPGRKTGMSDVAPESPLVGNAPLREGSMSPTRRRRRLPRRPSSAEDASADNSSCDIPPPATAPNVLPASTPNPLPASDSSPAPRLSVKKTEPLDPPLITPKQEMLDEPAEDIEDLTLDDDDDYNDAMSDMSKPGTSFGAMAPGNTSQDFSQWQQMMGAADRSGQDEVFMAAQEAINNQSNTQGIQETGEISIDSKLRPRARLAQALRKTCRFEQLTIKSLGASRSVMVHRNAFATQKASGRTDNSVSTGVHQDSSLQQKTVVLRSNALVLQKVDASGKQTGRGTAVLQNRVPMLSSRLPVLPRVTRLTDTHIPASLEMIAPTKSQTPRKPPEKHALLSLFEDDWKDEEDENVLPIEITGNSLNEDESNSPPKVQNKAWEDMLDHFRQSNIAQKLPANMNIKNHSPAAKTHDQLLSKAENAVDGSHLRRNSRPNSRGVLSYGRIKTFKEETRVQALNLLGRQRLNLSSTPEITLEKSRTMGVLATATSVDHIPPEHIPHVPTISSHGGKNVSRHHSALVNARENTTQIQSIKILANTRPPTSSSAASGSPVIGRTAASPGKQICTIRPYGCVQVSRDSSMASKTSNANSTASNTAEVAKSKSLQSDSWLPPEILPPSESAAGSVSATQQKTRCGSSVHNNSYSYTYSRIQSLWDNSKFEDEDLVLQPFQSDTSSNNIVLGHISEGSMKE